MTDGGLEIPNDDFRKVGTSEHIGATQVFDNEGRPRSSSDVFGRPRTDTFKHGFCDYDISQMRSEQSKYSQMSSADLNDIVIMHDERWYDKSSAAYFTSDATRNAQTIAWKQRHRPICQLYLDLQFFLIFAFFALFFTLIFYRKHEGDVIGGKGMTDMLFAQMNAIACAAFFLVKFLIFAIWYRCTKDGNVAERTSCVFWSRLLLDMGLYAVIGYTIYLEHSISGLKCDSADQSVIQTEQVCEMPLVNAIAMKDQVVHVHKQHFVCLGFLVLKELFVYFTMVRRATQKLELENMTEGPRIISYSTNAQYPGKEDHFVKN